MSAVSTLLGATHPDTQAGVDEPLAASAPRRSTSAKRQIQRTTQQEPSHDAA